MPNAKKKAKELSTTIAKQIATLAASGFSLVAALAWNDLIKSFIDNYVKPYVSKGSGFVAQLIYAVIITAIVVLITIQLTWLQERLDAQEEAKK